MKKIKSRFEPGQLVWIKARVVCNYTRESLILVEVQREILPTTSLPRHHVYDHQLRPRRAKKPKAGEARR